MSFLSLQSIGLHSLESCGVLNYIPTTAQLIRCQLVFFGCLYLYGCMAINGKRCCTDDIIIIMGTYIHGVTMGAYYPDFMVLYLCQLKNYFSLCCTLCRCRSDGNHSSRGLPQSKRYATYLMSLQSPPTLLRTLI